VDADRRRGPEREPDEGGAAPGFGRLLRRFGRHPREGRQEAGVPPDRDRVDDRGCSRGAALLRRRKEGRDQARSPDDGREHDVYYANKTYDGLYDQQASELDKTKRIEICKQMQQMFYEDAAYIIMWYQDKLQAYRSDTWTGWSQTPGGIVFNFTRANYLNAKPV
jgi:hypothetical protein